VGQGGPLVCSGLERPLRREKWLPQAPSGITGGVSEGPEAPQNYQGKFGYYRGGRTDFGGEKT